MTEDYRELIAAEMGVPMHYDSDDYSNDPDDYAGTVGEFAEQGIEFTYKDIEFFLPMQIPTKTHQSKRYAYQNGKIVAYDTPEIVAIREKFEAALSKYAPEQKISGPVRLVTKWCFCISDTRKYKNGEWKTTKPDVTNIIKLFEDCMTKCGFWKDDAQVASSIIEKFWAEIPGIYVRIEKL